MIHHNHPCGSQIGSYFYWVNQLYNCTRRIFDHWIANNQFSIFRLFFFVNFTWNPSSIIDLWLKVVFGSLCLSYTFAIIGFRMLVYCCLKAFKSKKLGVLIYYSFFFFFRSLITNFLFPNIWIFKSFHPSYCYWNFRTNIFPLFVNRSQMF